MVSSHFKHILLNLGVNEERISILERKGGIVEDEFEGLRYLRFKDSAGQLRRGTIIFNEHEIILGFPHIKRIVHLENGIRRVFKRKPFYVEEKVDGYNVRIGRIGDRILAFTRGGFVCPFSTERIEDFVNFEFFRDYPDMVLCAEMAGPESPYLVEGPPYVDEDIELFVFDIQEKKSGRFIPVEDRLKLVEEYSLPGVESFGMYDLGKIKELRELIDWLSENRREGIVMKSPDMKHIERRVKEDFDEYAKALGRALLEPFVESIWDVSTGEGIEEIFTVRVKRIETAHRMVSHFERLGLKIHIEEIENIGDYWRITFKRVYPDATREMRELWNGRAFVD